MYGIVYSREINYQNCINMGDFQKPKVKAKNCVTTKKNLIPFKEISKIDKPICCVALFTNVNFNENQCND